MWYTVTWSPFAQDQLADLWLAAADRDALTRAAHEIDRTLRDDPDARVPHGHEGARAVVDPVALRADRKAPDLDPPRLSWPRSRSRSG